jgi:hypothetical protein
VRDANYVSTLQEQQEQQEQCGGSAAPIQFGVGAALMPTGAPLLLQDAPSPFGAFAQPPLASPFASAGQWRFVPDGSDFDLSALLQPGGTPNVLPSLEPPLGGTPFVHGNPRSHHSGATPMSFEEVISSVAKQTANYLAPQITGSAERVVSGVVSGVSARLDDVEHNSDRREQQSQRAAATREQRSAQRSLAGFESLGDRIDAAQRYNARRFDGVDESNASNGRALNAMYSEMLDQADETAQAGIAARREKRLKLEQQFQFQSSVLAAVQCSSAAPPAAPPTASLATLPPAVSTTANPVAHGTVDREQTAFQQHVDNQRGTKRSTSMGTLSTGMPQRRPATGTTRTPGGRLADPNGRGL